jgi:hypothetical protein
LLRPDAAGAILRCQSVVRGLLEKCPKGGDASDDVRHEPRRRPTCEAPICVDRNPSFMRSKAASRAAIVEIAKG